MSSQATRWTGRARRGLVMTLLLVAASVAAPLGSGPATAADDPDANADVVVITTALGNIYVQMLPSRAPQTVAAFLARVADHSYDNTFVNDGTGVAGAAGSLVQGGQFSVADRTDPNSPVNQVVDKPKVANEPGASNLRGTISLTHPSGDVNGGSTAWFINDADNTGFDAAHYPAFGWVVHGMDVVDAITALRRVDASPQLGAAFARLPVRSAAGPAAVADLVYTDGMRDLGPLSGVTFDPVTPTAPVTPAPVPTAPAPAPAPAPFRLTPAAVSVSKQLKASASKLSLKVAGAPTGSAVTVAVKIPGATATGKATATTATSTKVVVKLTAKQRAHLHATHATTVKVTVTVTPPGAAASSVTEKVTLT